MEDSQVCGNCCNFDRIWGTCHVRSIEPVNERTECLSPDDYNQAHCWSCVHYNGLGHCVFLGEMVVPDTKACSNHEPVQNGEE